MRSVDRCWGRPNAQRVLRWQVYSNRDVVDQPRRADARGDQEADRTVLDRADRLERVGVAGVQIGEHEARALDGGAPLVEDARRELSARDPAGAILEHPV